MTKLAANWQFLLVSQIVKGKFFLRPDIAMSMGPQIADILAGKITHQPVKRSLEIITMNDTGVSRSFMYDDNEDNQNRSPFEDAPEGSVAIIPIKGTLMKYGTMCDYGTAELASFMIEAATHKNISAIVLDIDSGGGAVDAVAPLVQAIGRVKAMRKPITASIDLACSAAYWVASATDYLVADNSISAEVGSIGVMMSFMDMSEYYEKQGVKMHTIYSTHSADKNLSFQMALKNEYDMIREEDLDPLAVAFQNAVKENRKGKLNTSAKGILSGKTYFAAEAMKNGLIDRIGNRTTAMEIALGQAHARKLL
jgi:signal peptide peptidase SppA